ncbi:MAG: hypothetical protein WC979_00245 [Candidatus Pacearchaeota archaeon]|jgi:hypothetical protein|nr:hypothetical protein [Clostridia bacterium]
MAKITKFNRTNGSLERIQKIFLERLKSLEEELGVTLTNSGCNFDDNTCAVKITATIAGVNPNKNLFIQYHKLYDLALTDFNRDFIFKNKVYTITGIKPSRKNAILAIEKSSKKEFCFHRSLIVF